jgi:hypothetical protein
VTGGSVPTGHVGAVVRPTPAFQGALPFPCEAPVGSPWCQRWRAGRQAWRHVAEEARFQPDRYRVAEVPFARASTYVTVHYSRSMPAALRCFGLFDLEGGDPAVGGDGLVGAVVLSVPMHDRVLTSVWPELVPSVESAELGRMVLDDVVPANAESWTLARVFALAANAGFRGLVPFSDPVPRRASDGRIVMPGHVGYSYQAVGGSRYLGRSTARSLVMLPDATVLSARALAKVRTGERGTDYVERRLVAYGARPLRVGEDRRRWVLDALDAVGARRVRHGGNHRFAFVIGRSRSDRRGLVPAMTSLPYPKACDPE